MVDDWVYQDEQFAYATGLLVASWNTSMGLLASPKLIRRVSRDGEGVGDGIGRSREEHASTGRAAGVSHHGR